MQGVVGEAGQPVGQEVAHDAGQGGDALHVAQEAAAAGREGLALFEQAVHGDVDVAELAGHPGGALDDAALLDDAAAQAGADDRGDRRLGVGGRAEVHVVGVEGGRVAVVVVDDGQAQASLQGAPEVEAPPGRLGEVRRALGGDDAVGAGRAGGVEADGDDAGALDVRHGEDVVERAGQRLDRRLRALEHPARHLDESVHEERARVVEYRRVVRGAAVVQSDDDPVLRVHHGPTPCSASGAVAP
ncbi:hypothetical protein GCM10018962_31570 [Dactylosporangium matsuzakiense]